jgi:urea transport system ATP-binding protein
MLTVSALNQYYGGSHTLRNVAFEAPSGAVTAILGRNGVGQDDALEMRRRSAAFALRRDRLQRH